MQHVWKLPAGERTRTQAGGEMCGPSMEVCQAEIVEFFRSHTAFHTMPESGKVIVLDADLSLHAAFRARTAALCSIPYSLIPYGIPFGMRCVVWYATRHDIPGRAAFQAARDPNHRTGRARPHLPRPVRNVHLSCSARRTPCRILSVLRLSCNADPAPIAYHALYTILRSGLTPESRRPWSRRTTPQRNMLQRRAACNGSRCASPD